MKEIKYIFVALILLVGILFIFQSCEKDYEYNYSNFNSKKHFVSINQIKEILNNNNFKNLKNRIQKNNEYYKGVNIDSIFITDYMEIKDSTQSTSLYLTKLSDNSIVAFAADDRSHPVMSISDNMVDVEFDSLPPSYINWLYEEADAIKFAKDNDIEQTEEISNEWQMMRIAPDEETNDPWECPNKKPIVIYKLGTGSWV